MDREEFEKKYIYFYHSPLSRLIQHSKQMCSCQNLEWTGKDEPRADGTTPDFGNINFPCLLNTTNVIQETEQIDMANSKQNVA